jgi:(2Fe-2S) ferredoxin
LIAGGAAAAAGRRGGGRRRPGYDRGMPHPQVQILVCLNERPPEAPKPSCARRGSLEVYNRFKDRVRELGMRDRVMVTRTGCLKHCSRGITVAVWPYNLWYSAVTAEDVDEILTTTVAGGGKEVERLRMPDIPWE